MFFCLFDNKVISNYNYILRNHVFIIQNLLSSIFKYSVNTTIIFKLILKFLKVLKEKQKTKNKTKNNSYLIFIFKNYYYYYYYFYFFFFKKKKKKLIYIYIY